MGTGGGVGDDSDRGDIERLDDTLEDRRDARDGVIYGVFAGEGKG